MKRMFVMCLLSVCISLSIFARGNTESAGTIQQDTEAVETQWNRGDMPPDFKRKALLPIRQKCFSCTYR